MKIEFKKIPQTPKEFTAECDSVKIEGIFCKISPSLVKIDGILTGKTTVECIRCGEEDTINVDEELHFLLNDGIFKSNSHDEELVIEIENGIIDFDEIIESEIASIFSDYHVCQQCSNIDFVEKEY